ncbi:MAG: hypothetical protein GX341_06465 [Firmicutes bacterium]|nr:hypothetical protein [Bacillota bacterium]
MSQLSRPSDNVCRKSNGRVESSIMTRHGTIAYRERYIYCLVRDSSISWLAAPRRQEPVNSSRIMRSRDLNLPLTDPGD